MSTVCGQRMKRANHGSLQPAPGPFPASTQLLRTADFCRLSLMKVRPELNTYTASHKLHLHCQNTNRSLSSTCATLAQATLFAGQSLNTIQKHIPWQNSWNANSLPTGSGPFSPKMYRFTLYPSTDLNLPQAHSRQDWKHPVSLHQSGSSQTNWASWYIQVSAKSASSTARKFKSSGKWVPRHSRESHQCAVCF